MDFISGLAAAVDRYADVLRAAAEAGGAAERERTQLTVIGALVGVSRMRFHIDGAACDADATRKQMLNVGAPGGGGDWICGVLRRIRVAAAAVLSDARALSSAWPPAVKEAKTAPTGAENGEAPMWLIKIGHRCLQFSGRLHLAGQHCRALACARLCAELAAHAEAILEYREATVPGFVDSDGADATSPSGRMPKEEIPMQTPKRPPPLQGVQTAAQTATGIGGAGRANGTEFGPEASLALLCAARDLEGKCLVHVGTKLEAFEAFASSLSARCRLDLREGVADASLIAATAVRTDVLTTAVERSDRQPAKNGNQANGGGAPALIDLVKIHALKRAQALVESLESATEQPSSSALAASAVSLLLCGGTQSTVPKSRIADVAIAEIREFTLHAATTSSELAKKQLTAEAHACAQISMAALRANGAHGTTGVHVPIEQARVCLALAEMPHCLGDDARNASACSARDALNLIAPFCAQLHTDAMSSAAKGNGVSDSDSSAPADKATDVRKMKVDELRKELSRRGLDAKGNKADLQSRLHDALNVAEQENRPAPSANNSRVAEADRSQVATEDEVLVAVELYARAKLMLAFASLASPPARKSSPAAPEAPSEAPSEAGEETVVATMVADAQACAAASARAADEAEASLRAWSVLFKPLLNADILHAETLRRVLPDACRSVSAALRCAKVLWYLLRDGSAIEAALLASAAGSTLVPVAASDIATTPKGAESGSSSSSSSNSAGAADLAEAFLARMRSAMGDTSGAHQGLQFAAERLASAEPIRRVCFETTARPSMSPMLEAAMSAIQLTGCALEHDKADGKGSNDDVLNADYLVEQRLESLAETLSKSGVRLEAAHAQMTLARAARARGRASAAERRAREAILLTGMNSNGTNGKSGMRGGGRNDSEGDAVACDALLLLSELWMARGNAFEALRYAENALTIGRASALPRLQARVLINHATMLTASGKLREADNSLLAVASVLAPHYLDTTAASPSARLLMVRFHAAKSEVLLPTASTLPITQDAPLDVTDAATMEDPAGNDSARHAREAMENAIQARKILSSIDLGAKDSLASATERAVIAVRVGVLQRVTGANDAALATLRAACEVLGKASAAAWLAGRDGGGPALLAEALLQLGLSHLDAAATSTSGGLAQLWRPTSGASGACAALIAARAALTDALQVSRKGARPSTLQRICSALALSCGPAHAAAGSRLLASSIGVGVRHQVFQLKRHSEHTNGDGKPDRDGEPADDDGEGWEESAADAKPPGDDELITAALTALSLAVDDDQLIGPADEDEASRAHASSKGAPKIKGTGTKAAKGCGNKKAPPEDAGRASTAEAEWAHSLLSVQLWAEDEGDAAAGKASAAVEPEEKWMEHPPEGCAVVALALPPSGRGLLVSRWTAGEPPLLAHVPEAACDRSDSDGSTSDITGGHDAEALIAELASLMQEHRESSSAGTCAAAGEGERAAARGGLGTTAISAAIDAAAPPTGSRHKVSAKEGRSAAAASGNEPCGGEKPACDFVARLVPQLPGFATVILDQASPSITLGKEGPGKVAELAKTHYENISNKHCKLSLDVDSGLLSVTDMSTNGTFVNGDQIEKGKPTALFQGDVLSLVADTAENSKKSYKASVPVYLVHVKEPDIAPAVTEASTAAITTHQASLAPSKGNDGATAASREQAERGERGEYWKRREEIDARLGRLTARMQASLLRGAASLLIPPASEPAEREALRALGRWANAHAAAQPWAVHKALLSAACEALPCLDVVDLRQALNIAVTSANGSPLSDSEADQLLIDMKTEWARIVSNSAATHAISSHPGQRRMPLVLLLDAPLGRLPWESVPLLRNLPVCRLPCAAFLPQSWTSRTQMHVTSNGKSGAQSGSAFYVLNPAGDLTKTQKAFEGSFARPPWEGVTGEPPPTSALKSALCAKDLYVYCGHGDGAKYMPAETLQRLPRCAATLLMGCSSGALVPRGELAPTGMAIAYLHAGCPALVANLWDVTDGEIDKFCAALLRHCTEDGGSLLDAVGKARSACRLPFLTGAAAVIYGVPLDFLPRDVAAAGESTQGKGATAPTKNKKRS